MTAEYIEPVKQELANWTTDSKLTFLLSTKVRPHLFAFTPEENVMAYGWEIHRVEFEDGMESLVLADVNGYIIPYVLVYRQKDKPADAFYEINTCIDDSCAFLFNQNHLLHNLTQDILKEKVSNSLESLHTLVTTK